MKTIQLKREKRAYLSYLEDLVQREKLNPIATIEDGISVSEEINTVLKHINDLEFVIKNNSDDEWFKQNSWKANYTTK